MSFQGYPPVLVAIRLQHRHCGICLQQAQPKSEVTDQLQETGADHTQKTQNKNKKRDGNRDSDDRLRDLPEWLEEFTDNLEDTVVPALAHVSQDSDSERPTKVASREHSIHTRFQKDRNCEVCLRTNMSRVPCRKRAGEALPRAEKVW